MTQAKFPLKYSAWYQKFINTGLINTTLASKVLHGIRHGFDAHINSATTTLQSAKRNHATSLAGRLHILTDILRGIDTGFLLGPYDPKDVPDVIWSPLGTVPKDITKFRMIHDLSFRGNGTDSVNSLIDSQYTYVSYIQTRAVVQFIDSLGTNALFWVADMQDAYRRVPIRPQDRRFLGMKWEGKIITCASLPFGLSTSCAIYTCFAEAVRQLTIHSHKNLFLSNGQELLFNYLDDFFGGHSSPTIAHQQFKAFLPLLNDLGIPTQPWKCQSPNTIQKILGFLYNSRTRMISIPPAKVHIIISRINHLLELAKTKVSRRQIAKVSGVLMWVSQVIFPAKAMLRRIQYYVDCTKYGWDIRHIRLPATIKADLVWWKRILASTANGISFDYILKSPQDANIHIWTDAAGTDFLGCGGLSSTGHYFQLQWSTFRLSAAAIHLLQSDIVYKEFFAIVLAALLWAPLFTNKSVTFHCDNQGVVDIISAKNCAYHRTDLMDLMRILAETAILNRFWFWANHISGSDNIEADNLSRFKASPFARLDKPSSHTIPSLAPLFHSNPQFSSATLSPVSPSAIVSHVRFLLRLLSTVEYNFKLATKCS